jgi:hypothetical protein
MTFMADKRLFLAAVFLFFFIAHYSNGQIQNYTGYIVLNNRDTVFGILQDRNSHSNSQRIWFKASGSKRFISYESSQLLGFEMDSVTYFSRPISINKQEKQAFVRPLITARLNIFYFRDREVYVSLDSTQLREIRFVKNKDAPENRYYRGLLKSLASDCASLNADTIGSSMQSLIRFITEYNKCKGSAIKTYPTVKTNFKWDLGLVVGQTFSSINLSSYDRLEPISFGTTRSRLFGVTAHYIRSKASNFYSAELSFQELNFLGLPEDDTGSENFVQIHSRLARLTLGVNKTIACSWATPYIGLGALFAIPTKFEVLTKRPAVPNRPDLGMIQTQTIVEKNLIPGLWATIGLKIVVYKNIKLIGEARIEKSLGYGEIPLYDGADPLQASFVVGVLF